MINQSGILKINGVDLSQYRCSVGESSYASLLQYPSLKDPEETDFFEHNGVEVDLSSPVLQSKNFSLTFISSPVQSKIYDLLYDLSQKTYCTLEFPYLGITYNVRVISYEWKDDKILQLKNLSVTFGIDNFLHGYEYVAPVRSIAPSTDYDFDGNLFTNYDTRILAGTLASVTCPPETKPGLLKNTSAIPGVIGDTSSVAVATYAKKDCTIKCLMRAPSVSTFLRNWFALLHDLTSSGPHTLFTSYTGEDYPFYYKSSTVNRMFLTGKIWVEFDLTLCFYNFTVTSSNVLLCTETGNLITTEDNINFIDIS